jgi:ClpP class serine protease
LFEFIDILEEKYIEEINQVSKTKEKEIISPFRRITIKQNSKKIATNMLKNNEPVEKVSTYTGLTISEVEELKSNLK